MSATGWTAVNTAIRALAGREVGAPGASPSAQRRQADATCGAGLPARLKMCGYPCKSARVASLDMACAAPALSTNGGGLISRSPGAAAPCSPVLAPVAQQCVIAARGRQLHHLERLVRRVQIAQQLAAPRQRSGSGAGFEAGSKGASARRRQPSNPSWGTARRLVVRQP